MPGEVVYARVLTPRVKLSSYPRQSYGSTLQTLRVRAGETAPRILMPKRSP